MEERDTYRFYVDKHCEVWVRKYYSVEAYNQEEADTLIKESIINEIEEPFVNFEEQITLYDTLYETGEVECYRHSKPDAIYKKI